MSKKILFGMSAWGSHIDYFLQYGLPSLMSDGNLPALSKEYEIGINIHTDKAGMEKLSKVDMPFMLYSDVTDENKYHQLGRHQHKDLRNAKNVGADYHLLMPDFVYAEDCFAGVLDKIKEGHTAIARLVLSTVMETISPSLRIPRSAKELTTLALNNIHHGVRGWFVVGNGYPNTHVMAWAGKDTITMCSPHCTPVYIANEVIHIDDTNLPLDGILDKVIIGDIYFPEADDGIVIIEMAPEASREFNDKRVDLTEFIRIMKSDTGESLRQYHFFNQETVDPIYRELVGGDYWNEVEISEQKRIVLEKLMGE